MIRVAVTGGRNFTDAEFVIKTLDSISSERGPITKLFEGGAPGADQLARKWAIMMSIPVGTFFADWNSYRRAAGPIRNRRMLTEGKPDLLVAFPGGKGTASCVAIARELGIEVLTVEPTRKENPCLT